MNGKIYREGLRQLKKPAVFCTGICSFLFLLWILFGYSRRWYYWAAGGASNYFVRPARLLAAVFCALLTGYIFRFFNSKSGCDFYFQVSCSKKKLSILYLAGVWSWLAVLIAVMQAENSIVEIVRMGYGIKIQDFLPFLQEILQELCLCVYVSGVMLFAISISGNWIAAAAVFLMIVIVPGALLLLIHEGITANVTYFVQPEVRYLSSSLLSEMEFFFDCQWNMLWGSLLDMGSGSVSEFGSGICTAAVGILWMAAGLQMVSRRTFETAQRTMLYPWLQRLMRMIPAALVSFMITEIIFLGKSDWISWPEGITSRHLKWMAAGIAAYLFSAFLIYLYEGMTTRKWNCFLRMIPHMLLLIPLNLIFLAVVAGGRSAAMYYQPSPEQIKSVRIVCNWENDYFTYKVGEIDSKDQQVKEFVSDSLGDTINLCKGGFYPSEAVYNNYQVIIQTAFGKTERLLYLDKEAEERLTQSLDQAGIWQRIQQDCENKVCVTAVMDVNHVLDAEEQAAFTDAFRRDMEQIRLKDVYGFERWQPEYGDAYIFVQEGRETYRMKIRPEEVNLYTIYLNYINRETDEDMLRNIPERIKAGEQIYLQIGVYKKDGKSWDSLSLSFNTEEAGFETVGSEEISHFLKKLEKRELKPKDLEYGCLYAADLSNNITYYYPLTEETLKEYAGLRKKAIFSE